MNPMTVDPPSVADRDPARTAPPESPSGHESPVPSPSSAAGDRVRIGSHHVKQPYWKILLAIPLIYLPILTTVPFLVLGLLLVRLHLKYVGGMNLRSYREFVPSWVSHRYRYDNQVTWKCGSLNICAYRFFWFFNCKLYCPLSVALFEYGNYLVKIVENWWCPFHHDKKVNYAVGAVDQSFWHAYPDNRVQLHPDDQDNPMWNMDAAHPAAGSEDPRCRRSDARIDRQPDPP